MSRSFEASRHRRRAALAALAGLLACGLAAWLFAPALARDRLEGELHRRLGPAASFGELRVDSRGVRVSDLTTGELGRGLSLRIGQMRVAAFPPLLLWRPDGAIRQVELEGVRLLVRLPSDGRIAAPDARSEGGAATEAEDAVESRPSAAAADRARTDDALPAPAPARGGPQAALDRAQQLSLRALHRLAKGATVRVADAEVVSIGEDEVERELVTHLTMELTRTDREAFRTVGRGTTGDGTIDWELEVAPRELRAAGHVAFDDLPLAAVAPALPELPWHDPLAARLGGSLELGRDPLRKSDMLIEGSLRARDLALEAPGLHEEPLRGLALGLTGRGAWLAGERRLVLRGGAGIGDAAFELGLDGSLMVRDDRLEIEAEVSLPETSCRTALAAIPPPLRDGLEGFDWSGTIEGRVEVRLDTVDPAAARLRFAIEDECRLVSAPEAARAERLRGPFLQAVRHSDGVLRERLVGPGAPGWVPLEQVSPFLVHAVLAHEDAAFFRHRGFAPWAIETALQNNLRARRFAYGASTISMQLAKNLFLQRDKTVARKVREVLLTWYLESVLDKREILALYLNVIEYGPNVYGIGPAADHYFGRKPGELSPAESAFLATALPAPSSYHRQFVTGALGPGTRQQMRSLLERMHERERIDAAALQHGVAELEAFSFRRGEERPVRRIVAGSAAPLEGI